MPMSEGATLDEQLLTDALERLGIDHLVLSIHDASFPSFADEDVGRGSPYSRGGHDFLHFVRSLGFNAVQLGPQGRTSAVNPSPYDGTLFARNELSIALSRLVLPDAGVPLLSEQTLERLVAGRPAGPGVHDGYVRGAQAQALEEAYRRQRDPRTQNPVLASEVRHSAAEWAEWLEPDSLFLALTQEHGTDDWRRWPALDRELLWPRAEEAKTAVARRLALLTRYPDVFARNAFLQTLWWWQHTELRERLGAAGLSFFGDLQVGVSFQDQWSSAGLFLSGYRMGAPPSRTNPEGQPWGYPVLDPALYRGEQGEGGPALHFVLARVRRVLQEFDGVRVDHPHGWVCPWVYRADQPDPFAAVRAGARLFSSPDLPDHPALARHAIPHPDQLDRGQLRHADGWVRALDEAQVRRYSALLEVILDEAEHQGRDTSLVLCEVLSTWPYELRRVMERFSLGRFLVTQKADPNDPSDMYRSEHARPGDWIMLGTHDTESVWSVVPRWSRAAMADRARYLSERLEPDAAQRGAFAQSLASPDALVDALFAELFSSSARGVCVFFADLLGMTERYNAPGTVGPQNWTLRVPRDFRSLYADRVERHRALCVPRALLRALKAKRIREPALERALQGLAHRSS